MKAHRSNPFLSGIAVPAVVALTLTVTQAATLTWDSDADAGNGATAGSGTWDATSLNWYNGTADVVWPGSGNLALLGGPDGDYTITTGTAVTATNLDVEASGYTLANDGTNFLTLNYTTSTGSGTYTAAASQIFVADGKTFNIGSGSDATVVKANGSNSGFSSQILVNGPTSVLNIRAGATLIRDNSGTGNGGIRFTGLGTVNLHGTVSNTSGNDGIRIGEYDPNTVTFNVKSGGLLTAASSGGNASGAAITVAGGSGTATGGTNTLNIESGGTVSVTNIGSTQGFSVARTAGAVGVVNLAGTLTTPKLVAGNGGSGAVGTFNFNGGTLRANRAENAFIATAGSANFSVNLLAGGGIIDTNTFDVAIPQPLLGAGGLSKNGTGVLTLSGVNTYTGNTTLNSGGLVLADNGALKFVVTNGGSNRIQGTGAVTLDGDFVIDITGVTAPNPSGYTLVSGVTPTYGPTFTVTGWTEYSPGEWRGSGWKFTTADSKLVSLDTDVDGMEDEWEMQIVNANPNDGITHVSHVLPGDDFDGDLTTNYMEYVHQTSPINPHEWPDTDGDGLNDGWEDVTFGNNNGIIEPSDLTIATAYDTDGDGLDDLWEDRYYGNNDGIVDPSDLTVQNDKNADLDGDHNTDEQEAAANTDPNDNSSWPDADLDGLNDGWELFTFGTLDRATIFDTDGDFLADAYEDTFFGDNSGTIEPSDLTAQDAGGDPDGDGSFNYQESLSFTDPWNAEDFPDLDGDGLGDGHYLRLGDANSATTTSFLDGTNWDNEEAPMAGQNYVVAVNGLRTRETTGDFTFAGDKLALATGGALVWKNNGSITIPNLVLCGGLVNQAVTPNNTTVNLNGAITVTGFGSTLSGNNGPLVVNATIGGEGLLYITGSRAVTLTATNSFLGDWSVNGNLVVGNGTSGSVAFKPEAGGFTNKISGAGSLSLNGVMNIDTSEAGTTIGESWLLVDAGSLNETYGTNFTIPGFTVGAGTPGNRIWTKTGSPVWYQFSESTGLFIVMGPDTDFDGMADAFEQIIIDADPNDEINTLADVMPLDDFDGDHATNLMEFVHQTSPIDPNSWPDTDYDGINDGYEDFAFGDNDGIIEPSDLTIATAFDTDGDGWDDLEIEDVHFGNNDGIVQPSDLLQSPSTDFDGDGASNRQELVVDHTDMKSNASFADIDGDGIADGARLLSGDTDGSITSFNGNVGRWSDGFGPLAGMNYYVAANSLRTPNNTPADAVIAFPGNRLVLAGPDGRINFKSTTAHTVAFNELVLNGGNLNQAGGGNAITLSGNVTIRSASTYTGSNGPLIVTAPISGSGGLTSSGGTLTFAASNSWTGNLTANGAFALAPTGTMKFVPTTNGTSNSISGTGNVTLNGTLQIDLGGASTTIGHSWALVANGGTKTYGADFSVAGFTSNGAATGSRRWSSGNYLFDEATGTLSVAQPGFAGWIGGFGLDEDEQDPTDDPDRDGISNLVEYALEGLNPAVANGSVGSLNGLTITFIKRALAVSNGDVSYAIQQSTDLGHADDWSVVDPAEDNDSIISYTFPGSSTKDFIRLEVKQP